MPRTEHVFDGAVVLRALIGVLNDQTDAGAGSHAFEYAGENAHLIRFATLGGVTRGARTTAVQIVLQIGFGERNAGRHAVDDTTQRHPVRFTEGGDAENLPNTVSCHHGSLPLVFYRYEARRAGPGNAV